MLRDYLEELNKLELLSVEEETILWEHYCVHGDESARMKLIEQYQPLVLREAMRTNFGDAETMELVQEGLVGLMEAVDRYNPDKGVVFPVFAVYRIRGRMLDFLRKEGKKGILFDGDTSEMEMWWNHIPDDAISVEEQVEDSALSTACTETLSILSSSEKRVIEMTCLEGVSMKEVAQNLEVSESYAYRLQRTATSKLRVFLKKIEWD